MSLDLTDDKSTLVQVMAWCRQATSHYLSQCWPRFMSPYGVTRPQGVDLILFSNLVHYKCNIFVWNWSNAMDMCSTLQLLIAWCFRVCIHAFYSCLWVLLVLNSFVEHKNIFTLYIFLDIQMAQVNEILPHGRQGPVYPKVINKKTGDDLVMQEASRASTGKFFWFWLTLDVQQNIVRYWQLLWMTSSSPQMDMALPIGK